MTTLEKPTCEDCLASRKTGTVILYGYVRKIPKANICKQDGICKDWTPFPQETEGSMAENLCPFYPCNDDTCVSYEKCVENADHNKERQRLCL